MARTACSTLFVEFIGRETLYITVHESIRILWFIRAQVMRLQALRAHLRLVLPLVLVDQVDDTIHYTGLSNPRRALRA